MEEEKDNNVQEGITFILGLAAVGYMLYILFK